MLSVLLFLISAILTVALNIINLLPELDFVLSTEFLDNASDFLNGVAFFLPVAPIVALFEIKLLIISFRMFWAVCMRVKSFIPTISGT